MRADIIVLGAPSRVLPSPLHHLMQRLSLDRQIVWLDVPVAGPRGGHCSGPCGSTPESRAGLARLLRYLRCAARRGQLRRPVVWTTSPVDPDLLDYLRDVTLVYHRMGWDDDGLIFSDPGIEPVHRAVGADLVLAASAPLAAGLPPERTRVLPNAVDAQLFSTRTEPAPDLPRDAPVAGYFGDLGHDLDVALVTALARRMPDWRFLLIGPAHTGLARLRELPNLILAGMRPHQELPRYSQHWQASLILRRAQHPLGRPQPLKLREYLAAGSPVAANCDDGLEGFADVLTVARDAAGMEAALRRVLDEPRQMRNARRARVAAESWSSRAAYVNRLLDALASPCAGPLVVQMPALPLRTLS